MSPNTKIYCRSAGSGEHGAVFAGQAHRGREISAMAFLAGAGKVSRTKFEYCHSGPALVDSGTRARFGYAGSKTALLALTFSFSRERNLFCIGCEAVSTRYGLGGGNCRDGYQGADVRSPVDGRPSRMRSSGQLIPPPRGGAVQPYPPGGRNRVRGTARGLQNIFEKVLGCLLGSGVCTDHWRVVIWPQPGSSTTR